MSQDSITSVNGLAQPAVPLAESSWVTIGSKNQSSNGHHYYLFHIALDRPDRPFCFEESVGGGHTSGGGAVFLASSELEGWPGDWRMHLKQAGCEWVTPIIESEIDQRLIVAKILSVRECENSLRSPPAP